MEQVEFKPIHGLALAGEAAQKLPDRLVFDLGTERWQEIARTHDAHTALDDGLVFCSAGVVSIWPGRAQVWAIVSRNTDRRRMLWLHRQALAWLDQLQESVEFRRIEAVARVDHPAANRWLVMLGFEKEGHLGCYDADGNDHNLYSRIAWDLKQSSPPRP
jgi:hypothetical protein